MDRETAKKVIKYREPVFLETAKQDINGCCSYICPVCANGSGKTGTGIAYDPTGNDGNRYKCFVCGLSEDIIGLWMLDKNITDYNEALEGLYDYYGLQVDKAENHKQAKNEQYTHKKIHSIDNANTHTQINTDYYKTCTSKVFHTDYFKKRGLSEAVISKYMLGYDDNYTRSTGGKVWKAVIIPTGTSSFVARNTDFQADKKDRYRKNGASQLYLKKTLKEAKKPIFIVEGELDALSIIEAGGEAVGLGSTANYKKLVDHVKQEKPTQILILALDNDEDGAKTTKTLADELTSLSIPFFRYNPYGEAKDANGALTGHREAFIAEVNKATEEAKSIEEEELQAQKEEYIKTSTASHLQEFINGIAESVNTPYIPTGFSNLDNILDGGLYEGLYIVGAISSLGKTTLALQIADQIAQAGEDVLIFSLEMARSELMAKSISRLTLMDVMQNDGDIKNAKTTRGITTGSRYQFYNEQEQNIIQRAITAYGDYAGNIFIHEGIGDIGTERIKEEIKKHILFTGKKPTVLIDYVQILAPADVRATDKQNTDKAVLELKRMSRDYKIPVIGISSFNRANYSSTVSMEAFKESGSLEYSSDILIGLQLKGAGKKEFNANEAKQKNPREVELVILKNRNGKTGSTVNLEYYPMFNYFKEV